MTRAELIQKVAATMDEINPLEQGQTILNPQIDKQLDLAAITLMEMLPGSLAMPITLAVVATENYIEGFSVDVICPPDFIRLHRLKLRDWIRSVTQLHPDGDRLLLLQDYKHIKSTFRRPTASLHHRDGADVITAYPPPESDVGPLVKEFVYVKRPNRAEDISPKLFDLLAWNCAAIVYSISGQAEYAELCRNRLASMIEARLKHI